MSKELSTKNEVIDLQETQLQEVEGMADSLKDMSEKILDVSEASLDYQKPNISQISFGSTCTG